MGDTQQSLYVPGHAAEQLVFWGHAAELACPLLQLKDVDFLVPADGIIRISKNTM